MADLKAQGDSDLEKANSGYSTTASLSKYPSTSTSNDPTRTQSLSMEQAPTQPMSGSRMRFHNLSRVDHRTLERTNSINLTTGPNQVPVRAKMPVDFRTLRFVSLPSSIPSFSYFLEAPILTFCTDDVTSCFSFPLPVFK